MKSSQDIVDTAEENILPEIAEEPQTESKQSKEQVISSIVDAAIMGDAAVKVTEPQEEVIKKSNKSEERKKRLN